MSGSAEDRDSFEVLLARARSGDPAALEALFEAARPLIGEWASLQGQRMPAGLSRPSDIAQDTSIQAYTQFASFRGSTEAEWRAWLRAIVSNTAAQAIRAGGRKKRSAGRPASLDDSEAARVPSGQPSPSAVTATGERWQQLMAHIFELPTDQREAIVRVHLQELPIAEVAKQLHKTEAAVGGLLQRGLKELRARMGGAAGAPSPGATNQEAAAALIAYLKREGDAGDGGIDVEAFVEEHRDCADELRQMIDLTRQIRGLRPAGGLQ